MPRENRRLAAVMFTDMVGFSAMTHRDEFLSLELLREHRSVVRPLLKAYRGREVSTTGDGFVVEFGSTEDAVRCGLEIQRAFARRNSATRHERRINLRIAVHIGDVLGFDDDIYGDGVNIAARLQALAPPGGICISQSVYDQVQADLNCAVHSMGTRKLKGIRKPIHVYSLDLSKPSVCVRLLRQVSHRPKLKTAVAVFAALLAVVSFWSRSPGSGLLESFQRDSRGLTVAPFKAEGIPRSEAYFPSGLTRAVISGLSRRGVHVSPKDRGLTNGTIVTGTIANEKEKGKLRVTVSLVDASTGEVTWSGEFRGRPEEFFDMQDKIADEIAARFKDRGLASSPSGH